MFGNTSLCLGVDSTQEKTDTICTERARAKKTFGVDYFQNSNAVVRARADIN